MSSYFAKAGGAMGGSERLVCVTGVLYGGLLRVVDVDIAGNVQGSPSYLPANQIINEMDLENGVLVDKIEENEEQEIDWEAHADKPQDITIDEAPGEEEEDILAGDGRPNPMLAALQIRRQ